jgi:hypothetical protein
MALYSHQIIMTFIEYFLKFDMTKHCSKEGGGAIGTVQYITAATEAQKGGDNHFHVIGAIHGLPKTSKEFIEHLKVSAFKNRLVIYIL